MKIWNIGHEMDGDFPFSIFIRGFHATINFATVEQSVENFIVRGDVNRWLVFVDKKDPQK